MFKIIDGLTERVRVSRIYNQLIKDPDEHVSPPTRERPVLRLVPPPPNARMMLPHFEKKLWRRNAVTAFLVVVTLFGLSRFYHRSPSHPAKSKLQALDTGPAVLKGNQFAIERSDALKLFQKQDYMAAKTELERILILYPNSVEILNDLGMSYLKLKEYERAKKTWMKALRINPDDASSLNNLASLLIAEKDWPKATLLLTQALSLKPDLLEARLNLAIAFESSGKPLDAVPEYEMYLANPHALPTLRVLLQKRIDKIKSFSKYYEDEAKLDEEVEDED